MERNVQRIDGIVVNLGALSDESLEAYMGYAHKRAERAEHDLELLGIESARRFALADMALQDTIEFEPLHLVDPNQGSFDLPPEA